MFKHKILKNTLFKQTLVYGLTNALYSGLPLILMPFFVSVLDSADYGLIELFRNLTMIAIPLIGFSTVQGVTRFYYDFEKEDFNDFCSTISLFQITNGIIAICITFLLSQIFDYEYWNFILLAILFFIFNQLTELVLSIFRVTNKPKKYLFFKLMNIVVELVIMAYVFLNYKNNSWELKVIPQVSAMVIIGLAALYWFYFKENNNLTFRVDFLKTALVFSTPLILHMMSGYMLNIGDRFFILHYLNKESLGSYSLAYQISLMIGFVYTSFNLAWVPTFYKFMEEKKYDKINKIKRIVYFFVITLGIGSYLLFYFLSKYIPNIEHYNIDKSLVLVLIMANVILCFYKFESNYFFYSKNTKAISMLSLVSALVAVILNLNLIPIYGIFGAAITTLISFGLMYVLILILKNKYEIYKKN